MGLRLPMATVKDAGFFEDSEVDILVKDNCLVLHLQKSKSYNLKDLVSKISAENLHKNMVWGSKAGKEIW